VIGRDGSVDQLVPFDTVAWHAGQSAWKDVTGLNRYSLGIELDNIGPLMLGDDGVYRGITSKSAVAPEDVFHGNHKNGGAFKHWMKYTDAQVAALRRVCGELCAAFPSIEEITGHDLISPNRKFDPGPALEAIGFSLPQPAQR
jgi:N-acetylmuramoyl-L-alanine amidase